MTTFDHDAIICGAGAAGMMAAIHAAERGRRVLLLEKGKKPGVKILMSGGTRCNITHDCDNRGIVAAFGPNGKFLHSALASLSVQETVRFFEGEGVATKIEETGKVFPVSDKALDVLNALLNRLCPTKSRSSRSSGSTRDSRSSPLEDVSRSRRSSSRRGASRTPAAARGATATASLRSSATRSSRRSPPSYPSGWMRRGFPT
jgi:monoamine oxidase